MIGSVTKAFTPTAICRAGCRGQNGLGCNSCKHVSARVCDPRLCSYMPTDYAGSTLVSTCKSFLLLSNFCQASPLKLPGPGRFPCVLPDYFPEFLQRRLIGFGAMVRQEKRMRYLEVEPKMPTIMNYNNALYGVAREAVAKFVCVPYDRLVRNNIF